MPAESAIATREELRGTTHFYTLDGEFRFTSVSRTAANLWNRSVGSLLGRNIWVEFPSAAESEGYGHHLRAMRDRGIHRYRIFSPRLKRTYHFTLCPAPDDGLMCFFREATEADTASGEALPLSSSLVRRSVE